MPTVIDSLIIELGLDPSKFKKGAKEVIDYSKKQQEEWRRHAEAMEASAKRTSEFLGLLQNKLLQVGELFLGYKTISGALDFVKVLTKQDAATGRLAYTLETAVGNIDKWRNAAYLAGGSAEGVTGFIQGLTSEFQKFAMTGESNLIPYFRGLGVQIADANGKMRPFADIMRDTSNAVAKLGPAQGAEWLRSIGADQGSINLLIKGGEELDRYLKLGSQFGTLTAEQAENARKLTEAFSQLNLASVEWGRTLLNSVTPALIKVSEWVSKILKDRGNIDERSLFGRLLGKMGFGRSSSTPAASEGGFPSKEERLAFYRSEAAKRGIDPSVVETLVRNEGLNGYVGDKGSSFGDFQLHYGGIAGGGNIVPGLGDAFTKKTGLDARDKSTWKDQALFSLDQMKSGGLSPWHGWHGSPWAGINRGGASSTEIKINNININTSATDANSIAATIKPAIERSSLAYQGQAGPQ